MSFFKIDFELCCYDLSGTVMELLLGQRKSGPQQLQTSIDNLAVEVKQVATNLIFKIVFVTFSRLCLLLLLIQVFITTAELSSVSVQEAANLETVEWKRCILSQSKMYPLYHFVLNRGMTNHCHIWYIKMISSCN